MAHERKQAGVFWAINLYAGPFSEGACKRPGLRVATMKSRTWYHLCFITQLVAALKPVLIPLICI